jgi:AcrR family transcriptional regulator
MNKKKRTRLAPEARRAQLLDAAATIIGQHGLSGFTMEALAKEAGVSNPLVYQYFSSRRALLEELLELEFDRYRDDLQDRLNSARSFEDIVRVFVIKNFDEADRGNVIQILQSQPDIQKSIHKKTKKRERTLAQFLVNQLADTYALTRDQAERMAIMGSGASVAAAERVRRSSGSREETIDATVSFIVGGVESYGSSVRSRKPIKK